MIELKSLKLMMGTKLIFDDFDFKVAKGEKVGIIGGEGVGKSTLLDVIAKREYPDSGKVDVTGNIVNLNKSSYYDFSELGFAAMTKSERFKIMIRKALDESKGNEQILLLDEPTGNLETNDVEWLIDLLKSAEDLTVVVASNDRYFLKKVCSRTITLGDSEVEEIILPEVESSGGAEDVLVVENLRKVVDGEAVFQNVSFAVERGQKVAFVGNNEVGKTKLLKVLGAGIPVEGEFKFDMTTRTAYMPRVFSSAAARAELEKIENGQADFLILDNPTVCLDLLTIVELESALKNFKGTVIFADSDHEFIQAIATRIINLTPNGIVDRISTYEEFLTNEAVKEQIEAKYK